MESWKMQKNAAQHTQIMTLLSALTDKVRANRWHVQEGEPTNQDVNLNDFSLDKLTGDVYLFNNKWEKVANIRGDDGYTPLHVSEAQPATPRAGDIWFSKGFLYVYDGSKWNEVKGRDGDDGVDARDIILREQGGFLQWKLDGETKWNNLFNLNTLKGKDGKPGAPGKPGDNGQDAKEIELRKTDTQIQWRREGEAWKDLIAISELRAVITGGGGGGGAIVVSGVTEVIAGTGIAVDNTNPSKPVVSATAPGGGQVNSVVAGDNVTVDNTDPTNPIVGAEIGVATLNDFEGAVTVDGANLGSGVPVYQGVDTITNPGTVQLQFTTLKSSDDSISIINDGDAIDLIIGAINYLQHVVDDTTPQLGGNLDVNGHDIVSVSNGDIDIVPHGTGNVNLGVTTGLVRTAAHLEVGSGKALYTTYVRPQTALSKGIQVKAGDSSSGASGELLLHGGIGTGVAGGDVELKGGNGSSKGYVKIEKSASNDQVTLDVEAISTNRTLTFPDSNVNLGDIANKQPLDATLTALAGLATGANKIPYSTGTDAFGQLDFKDEDNMASDSATALPSQQSVKAYADTKAPQNGTIGFVNHGSTAGTSRPSGYATILWYGSIEPTNMANGDMWQDTA